MIIIRRRTIYNINDNEGGMMRLETLVELEFLNDGSPMTAHLRLPEHPFRGYGTGHGTGMGPSGVSLTPLQQTILE